MHESFTYQCFFLVENISPFKQRGVTVSREREQDDLHLMHGKMHPAREQRRQGQISVSHPVVGQVQSRVTSFDLFQDPIPRASLDQLLS
jgi:hypothetical protein